MELLARVCCCGCLNFLTDRRGDTDDDAIRRKIGAAVLIWVGIAATPSVVLTFTVYQYIRIWSVGVLLVVVACLIGVFSLLFLPLSTHGVTAAALLALTVAFLMTDMGNRADETTRMWTTVVIILDACLVLNNRPWVQNTVVALTLSYLAAESLDSVVDYGLVDAGYFNDPVAENVQLCDCPQPPCNIPADWAIQNLINYIVVFVTDFLLTRGFATGLRQQMAMVSSSVEVAEQVSDALARFDLDAAGGALTTSGGSLPPGLASGLSRLLANLASYRPYLPQSCFEDWVDGDDSGVGLDTSVSTLDPRNNSLGSGSNPSPRAPAEGQRTPQVVFHLDSRLSRQRSAGSFPGIRVISPGSDPTPIMWTQACPVDRSHPPQQRRVTLLTRNSCGMLGACAQAEAAGITEWLATEVERFDATVKAQSGMTELLSGDHLSASFGAVKVLGTQKERAVSAAVSLAEPASAAGSLAGLEVTVAVCAGHALCGDFGSAATQRFMIIGGVSSFVAAMERAAAAWHVGTLIDAAVCQDIEQHWHCRLRKRVTFPKLSPNPIGLWEVVESVPHAKHADEWMYELESAAPNPWVGYNKAVMQWCEEGPGAALAAALSALDLAQIGTAAAEALRALQERAQEGCPAPECALTAAALAGDPAPLK